MSRTVAIVVAVFVVIAVVWFFFVSPRMDADAPDVVVPATEQPAIAEPVTGEPATGEIAPVRDPATNN